MSLPYTKRYAGGFVDEPTETTPIDKAFLDAVEAALIQLCAIAPSADQVPIWNAANSRFETGKIANAQVAAAAAISASKLSGLVTYANQNGSAANTDIAWAWGGAGSVFIDLGSAGGGTIRSIGTPSAGQGTRVTFRNSVATPITMKNALAGGTGVIIVNRNGADIVLAPTETIEYVYATSNVWVEVTRGQAAAISKYGTLIDVVNTVAETTILQAAGYVVPANALGTLGKARVSLSGDFLQASGGANNMTIRVYWGGGAPIWANTLAYGNIAGRQPWHLQFTIANRNATNSQYLNGTMEFLQTAATPGTGIGDALFATSTARFGGPFAITADPAKDTTSSQQISVSFQWGTANASSSFRCYESTVEIL